MLNKFISSLLVFVLLIIIGYIYNDFVLINYDYWLVKQDTIISLYFMYLVPVFLNFFMSAEINKPSDFLAWIYFFLVVIPTVSLSPFLSNDFYTGVISCALVSIVALILLSISKIPESKIIPYVKGLSDFAMINLITVITFFFIIIIYLNYSFNLSKILDLSIFVDTYTIRSDFRDVKAGSSSIAGYAIFWLAKVLLPFYICYGLAFNKRIFILLGLFLQLMIFSVSAHKSFIFSIILIFAIFLLLKIKAKFYQWIFSFTLFTIISLVLYKFLNFNLLVDVFVRRAIITPGVLSNWWVNYFNNNKFANFENSSLGVFFESNYQFAAPFVIGKHYFGSEWTSANVNFATDAYGNAGWFAVFVFVFVLSIMLLIINKYSNISERHFIFVVLLSVPTFWSLIETSFISVMVTHGLFLTVLIILFFRNKG